MTASTAELLAGAEIAAKRGADVLRARFASGRTVDHKGAIDLVTDADRASEQVVLACLREWFPGHSIVAEETANRQDGALRGPCWYVDPLDGTTNYAHGVPHFCVSVAAWDEEGPLAAVVVHPLLGDCYTAARGGGAFLGGRPLHVSESRALDQSLVATGFPYDVWTRPEAPVRLFTAALGRCQGVRRFGAAALDLAYVAAGQFDGYFELGLYPWDVAAGILLVREAGGCATNLAGEPAGLNDRQILACNPHLHGALVDLLGP